MQLKVAIIKLIRMQIPMIIFYIESGNDVLRILSLHSIFMHSFIHSFHKYILVPTMLISEGTRWCNNNRQCAALVEVIF